MIIAATLFICINLIFAGVHSNMIKEGKKIHHGSWAFLYIGIVCLLSWLNGQRNGVDFNWWMLIAGLFMRTAIFSPTLNKMRKLGWWYVTPELKNVTGLVDALRKGRFIDYIQWQLFKRNQWAAYALYAAIAIAAIIIGINKVENNPFPALNGN